MPPKQGRVPLSPPPIAAPPTTLQTRTPRLRGVGEVPNPQRPKAAVRVAHGGELRDLFEVFPDLPRPSRPSKRTAKPSKSIRFRTRR